jgi:hypothetical protein
MLARALVLLSIAQRAPGLPPASARSYTEP